MTLSFARLTGVLTVTSRALLRVNPDLVQPPDPNLGTAESHFTIKQGDRIVAEGNMYATIEGTQARSEGYVVGRTTTVERNGEVFEGGVLLGHFRAYTDLAANISLGAFGGLDTEPVDPMVVQHGSCQAPAEPVP